MKLNYLWPEWPAPKNVHAVVSIRQHSVSAIKEILQADLQLPREPIWLNQVHGINAVQADLVQETPDADAAFTVRPDTICVVQTADCLPILITDKAGECVAAIHAGWRGLAAGIIENTLRQLPVAASKLLVWFGPAIGPEVFEVGEEVREEFLKHNKAATHAFIPGVKEGKWIADIFTLGKQRLEALGVENIYGGGECTYTNNEKYYSYRRKDPGRMFSLIWKS